MSVNDSYIVFIGQKAVTAAVPLVLAGVGELVAERAGVINVGIEGLMLGGAFAGYVGAAATGNGPAGVMAAMAAGMALALLFALVSVWWRADQIVAGTAINLLAAGLTTTAWGVLQGRYADLPRHAGFQPAPIPGLASLPALGPILFNQYVLCYLLGALVVLAWLMLRFTRAGVIIRALGDAPTAAAAAGVRVRAWRMACVGFAGACAGVAGSYLSIMRTHSFSPDMTGGQGFLVLALVIFGRWNIRGLTAGCFLFGAITIAGQLARAYPATAHVAAQWFDMLPYVAALVALAFLARGRAGPLCLGQPWPEESR